MEIQVEKILQDLGLETYMKRRAEENIVRLIKEKEELQKSFEELQKTIKSKIENKDV